MNTTGWKDYFKNPPSNDRAITVTYTNYKRVTDQRVIIPSRIWFGSTQWHTEPQWLMTALDVAKTEYRDFALKDIIFDT